MSVTSILIVFAAVVGLWCLIVLLAYTLFNQAFEPIAAKSLIRVLYLAYFMVLHLWTYFLSPYKNIVAYGRNGFWILNTAWFILCLFIAINWITSGRRRSI